VESCIAAELLAVFALTPDEAVGAHAGAAEVTEAAPVVMRLCSQLLAHPQSLQVLLMRLCWQMLSPQSLHSLLRRLCWQMPAPPQSLQVLLMQ
jgi:hypothetical protein